MTYHRPRVDPYDTAEDQPFWHEDDDRGPMAVADFACLAAGFLALGVIGAAVAWW